MRRRICWALGIAGGGFALSLVTRHCAPFSQLLTRFLLNCAYPAMSGVFARVAIPVGEFALLCLPVLAGYAFIRSIAARRPLAWLSATALTMAVLYFSYAALWMPLYTLPRAQAAEYDDAALADLTNELIDRVNELAGRLEEPASAQVVQRANALMGGGAKLARYPEWMSALSIAGIYLPWTAEALVNPSEPAWTLPFTACHELAHARGVAGELEANLVAYYACLSLGTSDFAHSANLCMLRYALGELRQRDEARWKAACDRLNDEARREMASINGFALSHGGGALSNLILLLSGDERGAASYASVVGALIAAESKTLHP